MGEKENSPKWIGWMEAWSMSFSFRLSIYHSWFPGEYGWIRWPCLRGRSFSHLTSYYTLHSDLGQPFPIDWIPIKVMLAWSWGNSSCLERCISNSLNPISQSTSKTDPSCLKGERPQWYAVLFLSRPRKLRCSHAKKSIKMATVCTRLDLHIASLELLQSYIALSPEVLTIRLM